MPKGTLINSFWDEFWFQMRQEGALKQYSESNTEDGAKKSEFSNVPPLAKFS
jgi:hypothetical protein